jgi:magnesium-transporting ATPase (P-type)
MLIFFINPKIKMLFEMVKYIRRKNMDLIFTTQVLAVFAVIILMAWNVAEFKKENRRKYYFASYISCLAIIGSYMLIQNRLMIILAISAFLYALFMSTKDMTREEHRDKRMSFLYVLLVLITAVILVIVVIIVPKPNPWPATMLIVVGIYKMFRFLTSSETVNKLDYFIGIALVVIGTL